jgi:hypothetical protein
MGNCPFQVSTAPLLWAFLFFLPSRTSFKSPVIDIHTISTGLRACVRSCQCPFNDGTYTSNFFIRPKAASAVLWMKGKFEDQEIANEKSLFSVLDCSTCLADSVQRRAQTDNSTYSWLVQKTRGRTAQFDLIFKRSSSRIEYQRRYLELRSKVHKILSCAQLLPNVSTFIDNSLRCRRSTFVL